ncbi:MAG: hypothetical protein KDB65_08305 [Calditrichaeota bacterium]|nr:hypothetical protein [Calditrichota bacterium]MCB9369913.1 hypothetical protein [Calditrichota bacterium]
MNESIRGVFESFAASIITYLPRVFAGFVLLAIGWLLGWFAKRVVIQLCAVLRVDRIARRFRWGQDFSKADIRYGVYNAIGNVAFLLVFLVLLNAAVDSMEMTALSTVIQKGVLFIPKLIIMFLILGLGWLVSGWVALPIQRTLAKEGFPRAVLIARMSKFVLRLFFAAMALAQLDIAREIVTIGFSIIFGVLGVLTIMVAMMIGRETIRKTVIGSVSKEDKHGTNQD